MDFGEIILSKVTLGSTESDPKVPFGYVLNILAPYVKEQDLIDFIALVRTGKKIDAIKFIRAVLKLNLWQAKNLYDLANQIGKEKR
jgi:ribosomal protein L7/L12